MFMRNSFKVAKWEVKRNLKNKSFIIGLFLTPLIILAFAIIPSLFTDFEMDDTTVYVKDELGVYSTLETMVESTDHIDWMLEETDLSVEEVKEIVDEKENSVFINLTENALEEGTVSVYMNEEVDSSFMGEVYIIEGLLYDLRIAKLNLTEEELGIIAGGVSFDFIQAGVGEVSENDDEFFISGGPFPSSEEDFLKRIIPGAFAGIVLFSIVISGMMIFQSASQEKKEKISEIILSSITPTELMQGKIFGYFALGVIQVSVWLGIGLPIAVWKIDLPILQYLFVPELAVLLLIAILGYLLFASVFVGIGATIEDASSAGNFQGLVLMLPFLPFIFLGPIMSNPNGIVAKVGSFIPFTSPGILIIRLSMLEDWPWLEIIIGIVILILSVWIFMKLAGKIFRTGILMYGKNATPKEIWKWLWA